MLANSRISGDRNVQVNGSNNKTTVNQFNSTSRPLTKSQIYNLLELVISAFDESNMGDNSPLEIPALITEKLHHNSAFAYIDIFKLNIEYFNIIDTSSQSMVASHLIVKQLSRIYLRNAERDKNGRILATNGDQQLDQIKSEIFEIITHDPEFDSFITREQVEDFIDALMLYGVWKCKILENPNKVR